MKLYTADEYLKRLNAAIRAQEEFDAFQARLDDACFDLMLEELDAVSKIQKEPPTPANTESVEARLSRLEEKVDRLLARPTTSLFPPNSFIR